MNTSDHLEALKALMEFDKKNKDKEISKQRYWMSAIEWYDNYLKSKED